MFDPASRLDLDGLPGASSRHGRSHAEAVGAISVLHVLAGG
jgi:hypothetical protein